MIARTHRFHGFNSLRHVYSQGQTMRGQLMAVKYIFNNKRQNYRLAVVVSRKVHKSAVVRNRIRRRVYEIVRRHAAQISRPYDIVITIFSDQVATISSAALETMVIGQLEKAGILDTKQPPVGHAIVVPRQSKEST